MFINTDIGAEKDVYQELKKVPEIKECFLLYGCYDIAITFEVQDREAISKFRNEKIRKIQGICSTICEKGSLPPEILANLEFQKYIGEFLKANPELEIAEFECEKKQIKSYMTSPSFSELPGSQIWTFSPDGIKAITTLVAFGEPDSDLTIYNRNGNKTEETLGFCGTPCGWITAFWLNNEQFIAIFSSEYFGEEKNCDAPVEYHGTISYAPCYIYSVELYDISKNTVTYYYFPELFESHPKNPWWKEQCEKVFGKEDPFCK